MATPAQIEANRRNSKNSTGPQTAAGKARSCTNRLSHGFTSSVLFIADEEREEFNLLLADLHNEFQPATASEQILLEKMLQNQWLSLRAYRLQSVALSSSTASAGYMPKDLGLLIRYHQSSDRGFYKARNELISAQKERKKSETGFESQDAAKLAETPLESSAPPDPPQKTTAEPGLSIPAPPNPLDCESLDDAFEALMKGPDGEIAKRQIAELRARRKVA